MFGPTTGPKIRGASFGDWLAVPNGAKPCLYLLPEIIVDDPQLGYIANYPVLGWIDSRDPPPSRWFLSVAQSIPDEPSDIELVTKDTRSAQRVPPDRRIAPQTTAWTPCTLAVELGSDGRRGSSPSRSQANGDRYT